LIRNLEGFRWFKEQDFGAELTKSVRR
jgi:hypothetical protein